MKTLTGWPDGFQQPQGMIGALAKYNLHGKPSERTVDVDGRVSVYLFSLVVVLSAKADLGSQDTCLPQG